MAEFTLFLHLHWARVRLESRLKTALESLSWYCGLWAAELVQPSKWDGENNQKGRR